MDSLDKDETQARLPVGDLARNLDDAELLAEDADLWEVTRFIRHGFRDFLEDIGVTCTVSATQEVSILREKSVPDEAIKQAIDQQLAEKLLREMMESGAIEVEVAKEPNAHDPTKVYKGYVTVIRYAKLNEFKV